MKFRCCLFGVLMVASCFGQGKLVFQMDFSGCQATDISGFNVPVAAVGNPSCVCSPIGDAFLFDGMDDAFTVEDTNLVFGQAFSLTVVFRPDSDLDDQRILSYKQACNSNQGFDLTYNGSGHQLVFDLFEGLGARIFFDIDLDRGQCWHAVTIAKSGSIFIVYLYGQRLFETRSPTSFVVGGDGNLTLGSGSCVPVFNNAFEGAIDYFSVYDEVQPLVEIQQRVITTNRITTVPQIIFIGDVVIPSVEAPCVTDFTWSPALGVADIKSPTSELAPLLTTFYKLIMQDGGCTVEDSLRILVVDPTNVTCDKLIFPTAFTPNRDGLNEEFFISNGFIIDELIRFEIFDRWGGRLFTTSDVNQGWDGSHEGEIVMPGVYIFKTEYKCNDEMKTQIGSFSVFN